MATVLNTKRSTQPRTRMYIVKCLKKLISAIQNNLIYINNKIKDFILLLRKFVKEKLEMVAFVISLNKKDLELPLVYIRFLGTGRSRQGLEALA